MSQLVAQKDYQLLGKIMKLNKLFKQHEDMEAAGKSQELGRKTLEKEFAIAFCGHFSAGKSSMINRLIGEDILPSSPIPTSANLVKVKTGEEYARVFFKKGNPRLYPAPYDYEAVKSFCKDGDQIESLEISHKGSGLLSEVVIMDTPGIDSAVDAHRIATESALHLADLVLYVMDYNHVQSELNFLFTKELTEAGKELYLVVNMIDKHRVDELSFDEFQQSVANSFAAWGVRPKGIFYTSLKKVEHPYNQFDELQQFLQERVNDREQMLPESVYNSLVKVSEDHINLLSEHYGEQAALLSQTLESVPKTEWASLQEKYMQLKNKKVEIESKEKKAADQFITELESILKSAYLMPFKIRELAESYLKAMQPEFKFGLFFAKQKTEQEREKRLEQFYQELTEVVQAQLDWHLKEFLLKTLKENGIQNNELQIEAQSFETAFSKELLKQIIKTGAVVSGDYVLNYTNDVAEALKRQVRNQLQHYKETYVTEVQASLNGAMMKVLEEEQRLYILVDAYEKLLVSQQELASKKESVFDILYSDNQLDFDMETAHSIFVPQFQEEIVSSTDQHLVEASPVNRQQNIEKAEKQYTSEEDRDKNKLDVASLIDKLSMTAMEVSSLPGLKKISKELIDKAERLKNQQFTVALFGAFSAGKSSFANALIGEKLLPVSPNPTTAAINKIKPVDEIHPHGTVVVKVKSDDQLLEELNRSLKVFDLKIATLHEAEETIKAIHEGKVNSGAAEKLHYSFLHAFSKGFGLFEERLGQSFITDLESFRGYVADEEKSCFVEWIEVYYDCELTRKGISLVDTPGADSINARHTNVAFDYIKNSDAILFVTYYNHAFSRADREFLIQLGRVKDSFELDKMFFIVNAIDLANSEEEMQSVLQYVEDQLVQHGIRKPHMYPVSSLEALQEKITGLKAHTSRFPRFEQAFYTFISGELMKIAMDSAEAKWQQSLHVLEKLLISAREGQENKENKLKVLSEEKNTILRLIKNKQPDFLIRQLSQETEELVYYIKQRVFLRFSDFFREAFNPALLKEDGRDLKKALRLALDDLIASLGYDLLQEVRATTLRIENYISKALNDYQKSLSDELKKINVDLALSSWDLYDFGEIDFEEAFTDLDREMFKKTLGLFKNPKAFFEKNEKKSMSEELEKLLQSPADAYLQVQSEKLTEYYFSVFHRSFSQMIDDYVEQVEEYYIGVLSAINIDFPIEQLEERYNKVQKLV
ncbi:dynamin family protein [Bacillus sp. B15-48]|uniref:dynamin family protein n=1 Tax=Bacillus sp. B15-48 TaxID=1548601 RepID=UPI00193F030C|nr:dynamin family protein [Bacillus sp. B15-48]MBM4762065.1 Dynamin family protein [Bacillus sp. B15-48]